ncbi:hypothetical protein ANCCAN_16977 [Ancylostoma caninum]|uniref:Uncharacterized protein n=1 Tax=Ancylostoma caninum TaxID=29170 RepID=A0A368G2E5_ANCCA|nr:hypothetical protein ANCCAN_16977 [Ancylostoma caninum]
MFFKESPCKIVCCFVYQLNTCSRFALFDGLHRKLVLFADSTADDVDFAHRDPPVLRPGPGGSTDAGHAGEWVFQEFLNGFAREVGRIVLSS